MHLVGTGLTHSAAAGERQATTATAGQAGGQRGTNRRPHCVVRAELGWPEGWGRSRKGRAAKHSRNPNAPWERRGSETSGRTDQAKLGSGKKPAAPEDSPVGGLQKWGTEDAGEARIRRDGHAQRPLYAIWALSEDLGHGRNAMRTRTGLESRAAGREAPRESGGEAMVARTGVAAAGRTAGEPTGLRIAQEGNERRPGRRPGEGRAGPATRAAPAAPSPLFRFPLGLAAADRGW